MLFMVDVRSDSRRRGERTEVIRLIRRVKARMASVAARRLLEGE